MPCEASGALSMGMQTGARHQHLAGTGWDAGALRWFRSLTFRLVGGQCARMGVHGVENIHSALGIFRLVPVEKA